MAKNMGGAVAVKDRHLAVHENDVGFRMSRRRWF